MKKSKKTYLDISKLPYPIKLGTHSDLKYSIIHKSKILDGWVKSEEFLPIPFDLVHIKPSFTESSKVGWWDGKYWMGIRIKPNETFKFWKRVTDRHEEGTL